MVPSVTMKEGSLARVMSRPLSKPNRQVTAMPASMARAGCTPLSTASLVTTMEPRAMTMPQDRSIPAVRMMRVWPMASTPTTMTCCTTSDRFSPVRKRSDWVAKNRQAAASAIQGPSAPQGICREVVFMVALEEEGVKKGACAPSVRAVTVRLGYLLPQHRSRPTLVSLLSTPATGLPAIRVTPVST